VWCKSVRSCGSALGIYADMSWAGAISFRAPAARLLRDVCLWYRFMYASVFPQADTNPHLGGHPPMVRGLGCWRMKSCHVRLPVSVEPARRSC
jgi:hypothetical protein